MVNVLLTRSSGRIGAVIFSSLALKHRVFGPDFWHIGPSYDIDVFLNGDYSPLPTKP